MKSKRIWIFQIISVFMILKVSGQEINPDTYDTPNPASPEVASLFKYSDIPVSTYSGFLQYSIPIFEIKVDGLVLPISLNYNSNGIKVEEEANWVGLGWNLNVGGCISRQVNSIPDDLEKGWINDANIYKMKWDVCQSTGGECVGGVLGYRYQYIRVFGDMEDVCTFNEDECIYYSLVMDSYGNFIYDQDPDYFYFNIGNLSGKFFFDKEGNIHQQEYSNIIISEPVLDDYEEIIEWTITDESGNQYIFSQPERQLGNKYNNYYYSTWHISEIITPTDKHIYFNYYPVGKIVSMSSFNAQHEVLFGGSFSGSYTESTNFSESVYLKEIIYDDGKIEFNIIEGREDLEGASRLESINIYNTNGRLVKKHKFNNASYFISPTPEAGTYMDVESTCTFYRYEVEGSCPYSVSDTIKKRNSYRLKLESYEVTDVNENDNEKYIFYYNDTLLPVKTSYSVDLWGLFNNFNNTSKLSSFYGYLSNRIMPNGETRLNDWVSITNANRNPNNYGKACILEKVKLPTGGGVSFDYELNEFTNGDESLLKYNSDGTLNPLRNYGGGFRIKSITTSDSINDDSYVREFSYSGGLLMRIPSYFRRQKYYSVDADGSGSYYDLLLISTSSNSSFIGTTGGGYVGYDSIVESFKSSTDSYKKEYKFYNQRDYYLGFDFIYYKPYYPLLGNGTLLEEYSYDSENNPVQSKIFDYDFNQSATCYGVKSTALPHNPPWDYIIEIYEFEYFKLPEIWKRLNWTSETVDGITNTNCYYYNDKKQVSKVETTNSKGETTTTNYFYPPDYGSATEPFIVQMKAANIINKPIETFSKKGDLYTSGQHITYKTGDDLGLPDKVYSLKAMDNWSTFKESNTDQDYHLETNFYEPEITYDLYNNGNLLQYHKEDNIYVSYYWAYNKTLPIIKAENAQYDISGSTVDLAKANMHIYSTTYTNLDEFLKDVGDFFDTDGSFADYKIDGWLDFVEDVQTALPDAMVTLYTYDPLVGMTSATDPNGRVTFYQYDDFGRLLRIVDHEGNIVEEYHYNYAQE